MEKRSIIVLFEDVQGEFLKTQITEQTGNQYEVVLLAHESDSDRFYEVINVPQFALAVLDLKINEFEQFGWQLFMDVKEKGLLNGQKIAFNTNQDNYYLCAKANQEGAKAFICKKLKDIEPIQYQIHNLLAHSFTTNGRYKELFLENFQEQSGSPLAKQLQGEGRLEVKFPLAFEELKARYKINLNYTIITKVGSSTRQLPATLSKKEANVIFAVAAGLTNREIALQAGTFEASVITEDAVRTRLRSIYSKLSLNDIEDGDNKRELLFKTALAKKAIILINEESSPPQRKRLLNQK